MEVDAKGWTHAVGLVFSGINTALK